MVFVFCLLVVVVGCYRLLLLRDSAVCRVSRSASVLGCRLVVVGLTNRNDAAGLVCMAASA